MVDARKLTPLEAFEELIARSDSVASALSQEPLEVAGLASRFLANPELHQSHLEIFMRVYALSFMAKMPLLGLLFRASFKNIAISNTFLSELAALKKDIVQNIQPGDFAVTWLPSTHLPAPPEWGGKWDLHLLQVRAAVHPSTGLRPERVSLRIEVDEGIRLIDCSPSTEYVEIGDREITISSDAKIMQSLTESEGINISSSGAPINASITKTNGISSGTERSHHLGQRLKGKEKELKVVSSAVGSRARWEILATRDEIPVGGLTYLATLMVPKDMDSCAIEGSFEIDLGGWGTVKLPLSGELDLAKST